MKFSKPDGLGFSFKDYKAALGAFVDAGYRVSGFESYVADPQERHLILRHDCDNSIEQAVRIARIDAELGCQSAFFLRVHAAGYNLLSHSSLSCIREIEGLGHEVGLHLEGGFDEVFGGSMDEWADRQRSVFESAVRRDMTGFSSHEPARMGGIEFADKLLERWSDSVTFHAYEERFTTPAMKYLSDSSGNWREGHFGLWVGREERFQVLTHPIWWFETVPAENY